MKRALSCLLIILLVSVSLVAQSPREGAFLKDLEGTKSLLKRGRWKPALAKLDEILQAHEGQDYVRLRLVDVEEIHRRCTFRLSHPAPDPRTLVSGDLRSYRLRTGKIEIHYRSDRLKGDFQSKRGFHFFAARFAGPHSIEFTRVEDSVNVRQVILCAGGAGGFAFAMRGGDLGRKGVLLRTEGMGSSILGEALLPTNRFKRIRSIKIKVDRTHIRVLINNRHFLSARKSKDAWGHFGFSGCTYDTMKIEGMVEPAWIQGKIDAAMQKKLAAFKKKYDPRKGLPEWLFAAPEKEAKSDARTPVYPGKPTVKQAQILRRIEKRIEEGKARKGLEYLKKLNDDLAPEAAREFLTALCYLKLRRYEDAMKHVIRVCDLDPESGSGRLVKASLLARLKQREAAATEFRAVVEAEPQNVEALTGLAMLLLSAGKPEEARGIVEKGLTRIGRGDKGLKKVQELIAKALNGPNWARVHEYKTPNYHVFSDIGKKTCADAARVLEDAFRAFNVNLKWTKGRKTKRFRVYLFSGQAGYLAFCKNLTGVSPTRSAGLFSPRLKHLLVWNLPNRELMMRTVRHEAFHQYLDRLMVEPPSWFNEGLAEYYETAGYRMGRWQTGLVRSDHLRWLGPGGKHLMPLKKFLHLRPRDFYGKHAPRNYAQAWAFMHFLRLGPGENKKLFNTLFEKLQEPRPTSRILDEILTSGKLQELESSFRKYLSGLK